MSDSKQTVTIPRNIYLALKSMKRGLQKCDVYDVIMAYAFEGQEPDASSCDGTTMMMYELAKTLIDQAKEDD